MYAPILSRSFGKSSGCGEIVAHVDRADLAIAEIGAAVPVHVDADHFAMLGERGEIRAEHLDLAQAAMNQHQRLAFAVNGVVVIHAVDGHVAALRGLRKLGHYKLL
jgi:hypothetical protein